MIELDSIQVRLDSLLKPPGSLGRLETLAADLARTQGTLAPQTQPRRIVLFAADHGVVASGVSAWPSEVTRLMLTNITHGGAASSVFARVTQTELHLVDVGVIGGNLHESETTRTRKTAEGTRDLSVEDAMTEAEFDAAWNIGANEAKAAIDAGCKVLATGEMGIGNSTSAACITSLLCDLPATATVGRGAGADDEILQTKHMIVQNAVSRVRSHLLSRPKACIAAMCGFEIAAMAGFFAEATTHEVSVILDGYIATSAAIVATHFQPTTTQRLIAAHRSAEPGHTHALKKLNLVPYLDGWQLRLGEGTGALLLMPLLDCAAAMFKQMASIKDIGVVRS